MHTYPTLWGWNPKDIWSRRRTPWKWDCEGTVPPLESSSSWLPGNKWRIGLWSCSQTENTNNFGFSQSEIYNQPITAHLFIVMLPISRATLILHLMHIICSSFCCISLESLLWMAERMNEWPKSTQLMSTQRKVNFIYVNSS